MKGKQNKAIYYLSTWCGLV